MYNRSWLPPTHKNQISLLQDSQMVEFMCLSPLSLKASGACLHPLRMGLQAMWQQLRSEFLQIKPRDDDDDPCQPKASFFYNTLGLLAIPRTRYIHFSLCRAIQLLSRFLFSGLFIVTYTDALMEVLLGIFKLLAIYLYLLIQNSLVSININ